MRFRDVFLSYRQRFRLKSLQYKYREHAHPAVFDWDWEAVNYNRIALINYLVGLRGGLDCRYLEIGCAGNDLFDSVYSSHKIGVDPTRGGTHRTTSDEFFASNTEKFDVIFIDGLHEYEQVHNDAVNALTCLNDGGWIAFHDFLPRSWKEHHVPRLQAVWTGDCWKAAVELARSDQVDFRIFNIDFGVGLMRPKSAGARIVDLRDDLREKQFAYFVDVLEELPRVDWSDGLDWINSYEASS